jgi:hypothetical protein
MATSQTKNAPPRIDAAFEQFKELNEQVLAGARKAGNLYVDTYETAVDRALELELKVAGMAQQEWLKSLIEAQADFTRELTDSYVAATRRMLG